ncbi:MAG: FixH family protein [Planctomycetota bacterium]|nr:FixH family protein [Planctomycetota bacterium]
MTEFNSDSSEKTESPGCIILALVFFSLLIGLAMLVFIAGCQSPSNGAASSNTVASSNAVAPQGPGWRTMTSADGSYQVHLYIPDPAPLNQEFTAHGTVFKDGIPISESAEVVFDGGMPQHAHGLAVPVVTLRRPAGGFVAAGVRFHMGGRWLLTVDIIEGPHLERARGWVEIR